ncbi:MAG: molybdopterin-dependent oxidoreductase, partial [Dehalococcoidales bacterium]|nr:molybdopterin-dependent oxidoreductase [Dehalococcoidales bacterium]
VDIITQKADIGVNHDTTYSQIVADVLGMRYEDINMRSFNDVGFELMTADGSCNLCSNGYVVRKAAKRCKQRLLEAATTACLSEARSGEVSYQEIPPAFPGMEPDDLDVKDSYVFEKANPENKKTVAEVVKNTPQTQSAYQEPVYAYAWHRQGRFGAEIGSHRLLRQAHFIEVEVDTETGEVEITNVVNVNDVGKVINWGGCEGQSYGGMYMAMGGARSERMIYDPMTGVLLNGNLEGYKWTTIKDVGPIKTILLETSLGYGPYGAGGIGENVSDHPVTLLGLAIHNAIDKWIDSYPITPDKVLKALGKI